MKRSWGTQWVCEPNVQGGTLVMPWWVACTEECVCHRRRCLSVGAGKTSDSLDWWKASQRWLVTGSVFTVSAWDCTRHKHFAGTHCVAAFRKQEAAEVQLGDELDKSAALGGWAWCIHSNNISNEDELVPILSNYSLLLKSTSLQSAGALLNEAKGR